MRVGPRRSMQWLRWIIARTIGSCAIALILALLVGAEAQSQTAAEECDRYAASPEDMNRPLGVAGVKIDKVDWVQAEAACRSALTSDPNNPRLNYQLARALYSAKQYGEALGLAIRAANLGHASALTHLGVMYNKGAGVAQDDAAAVEFYRKAAALKDRVAMHNLGAMYELGRGVEKDMETAVYWYKRAADAGYQNSRRSLERLENAKSAKRAEQHVACWAECHALHTECLNNAVRLNTSRTRPETSDERIGWHMDRICEPHFEQCGGRCSRLYNP
jgi:TPR repeat protein